MYKKTIFFVLYFLYMDVVLSQSPPPILQWATYYGGDSSTYGWHVTTDDSGYIYIAGRTSSRNNIAYNGLEDTTTYSLTCFLAKFNPLGQRIWGTFYGGYGYPYTTRPIPGNVTANVAVDHSGNVYLSGFADSAMNITSGGFQNNYGGGSLDAFLVKFNSQGQRLWATYYGGSGADFAASVAVDRWNNVYLAGATSSPTGIAYNGFQNTYGGGGGPVMPGDGFLIKFDSSGNRLWATYYGGSGDDWGFSVATDHSGNAVLAGLTG